MTAEEILSSEPFKRCAEFHGHVCPGLAVGFKAAQVLRTRLGVTRAPDEELVAIVETDACGADAIQVMTGCTLGKGNLIVKNYGKHAFSLFDRKRGRGLRACLRSGAIAPDRAYVTLFEKVRQGKTNAEEVEAFHHLREKQLKEILAANPETLFTIEEIEAEVPPESRIVESAVCEWCREPTRVDLLRNVEGRRLCIPCAEKASEKGKEDFK